MCAANREKYVSPVTSILSVCMQCWCVKPKYAIPSADDPLGMPGPVDCEVSVLGLVLGASVSENKLLPNLGVRL